MPLRLLAIGLPLTIVAGALAGVALLGELTFIEAVLLAIVLAPTDAALGQAVVTDDRVPSRVRQGLNVESGLNDGICVPLLLIAIAIAEAEEGAIGNGAALHLVLEEIGYGCIGGVIAGLAAAVVIRVGVSRRLIDSIWLQVVPVAGAALAYGLAVWMGGRGSSPPSSEARSSAGSDARSEARRHSLNTIFLTIGLSVLLHGLTAAPLAGRYAAWFAAHPRDAAPAFESAPAPEQRPHHWAAGLRPEHRDLEASAPPVPSASGSE